MDKFEGFKNKLSNKVSNDLIGEVEGLEDLQPIPEQEPKQEKPKFKIELPKFKMPEPKPKKKKTPKQPKTKQMFNKTESSKKSYPILSIMGIDEKTNIDGLITSKDINNVVFTLEMPSGLNPKEVSRFCDTVSRDVHKYIKIIETRDEDIKKLAAEITRLENEIQEEQQKSELTSFITSQQDEEMRLKNELADLRLENNELKGLKNENEKLKKKIESLQANRQDLVLPDEGLISNNVLETPKKRPVIETKKRPVFIEDDFDELDKEFEDLNKTDIINETNTSNNNNLDDDMFDSMLSQI